MEFYEFMMLIHQSRIAASCHDGRTVTDLCFDLLAASTIADALPLIARVCTLIKRSDSLMCLQEGSLSGLCGQESK